MLKADEAVVEEMVRAFGQENHQGQEFDWAEWYGKGFDVVNFVTKERKGGKETERGGDVVESSATLQCAN